MIIPASGMKRVKPKKINIFWWIIKTITSIIMIVFSTVLSFVAMELGKTDILTMLTLLFMMSIVWFFLLTFDLMRYNEYRKNKDKNKSE